MQMVVERIESRVGALKPPADTRQAVEQWLHELLPLDEERWAENEVWLAFAGRALVDSRLRARHEEVDEELRGACLGALQELDSAGRFARDSTWSSRPNVCTDWLNISRAPTCHWAGRTGDLWARRALAREGHGAFIVEDGAISWTEQQPSKAPGCWSRRLAYLTPTSRPSGSEPRTPLGRAGAVATGARTGAPVAHDA